MPRVPVTPPPGLFRNGTRYQAKDRWYDANLIRFFERSIRPVGGWYAIENSAGTDIALAETGRTSLSWVKNSDGSAQMVVGTHLGIYHFRQGVLTDITPATLDTTGGVDSESTTGVYGAGAYGIGAYGVGDPAQSLITPAALWQIDTFGDYLVAVLTPNDRTLWYWTGDTGTNLVACTDAPACDSVVVTPERFIVALGAGTDPRLVQWATQQGGISVSGDWTPTATNTAGNFPLPGPGKLMTGRRGRNETLLWTTQELYAMRYIGGSLVFSFEQLGNQCGIISRNAVAMADNKAIWMSYNSFFIYDGFVQPIPCDVSDYVFSDLNVMQSAKIWAQTIAEYGEVWFFYPSGSSLEPDRYVVYNYREGHWTTGTLTRTGGFDAGAYPYPIMIGDTAIYAHEQGKSYDSNTPYLESGPIEIATGQRVLDITRVVPDERSSAGQALGNVQLYIFTSYYPTATETQNGPYTMANPTDVRLNARQIRLRLESILDDDWRVGTVRIDVQPGGER